MKTLNENKLCKTAHKYGIKCTYRSSSGKRIHKTVKLLKSQIKLKMDKSRKMHYSSNLVGKQFAPGVPFYGEQVPFVRAKEWYYPIIDGVYQL